jgi:predicted phosphoribosyltransferase
MSTQAVRLDPGFVSQKRKQTSRAVVETASHLSGIAGLHDAATQVGKAVSVVEKGIATGATKVAGVAAKWGWKRFAAFCLKVAAASPLIAKIAVGVAVVAVAVCIFQVVRAA